MSSRVINQRVNFASVKNPMPYPDFLDVQLKSFRDFLQLDTPSELRKNDGLYKVFAENFPIADTRNNFVLEFIDYYIDEPRYTIQECLERGLTYSVPLKAKLKLYCTDPDHEDFDTVVQDVFLGSIPYMSDNGTFIINGAERVVVSQLHRSPGVFFGSSIHANGTQLYSARIIPFKGSWIEFATDINNVMYAYIDRKKKLPVTTLLRAIGFENKLLYWLPNDLKRFKALTTGHTIIMGRRTFESLPKGALPNRRNVVLSRTATEFEGCDCYPSLQEALAHCAKDEDIYIIGGASVYEQALAIADRLCLTEIHDTPTDADAFFPEYDGWKETAREEHTTDEKHHQAYAFVDYVKP